jgi:hypothetical protein
MALDGDCDEQQRDDAGIPPGRRTEAVYPAVAGPGVPARPGTRVRRVRLGLVCQGDFRAIGPLASPKG